MQQMKIVLGENQRVEAHYKNFVIKSDQPARDGGDESAPSPFDLFLASLGNCAGYYVKKFCKERNIPEEGIELLQRMHRNKDTGMIARIDIDIVLPPGFPEKYKGAVVKAAEACSVKKHIGSAPEFILRASQ